MIDSNHVNSIPLGISVRTMKELHDRKPELYEDNNLKKYSLRIRTRSESVRKLRVQELPKLPDWLKGIGHPIVLPTSYKYHHDFGTFRILPMNDEDVKHPNEVK